MIHYLEYQDEKSHKFWEITFDRDEDLIITTYGKIGTQGQKSKKEIDWETLEEVEKHISKQVASKIKKGYQEKEINPNRELSVLVKKLLDINPDIETTTIYTITTKEEAHTNTDVNRVGGLPLGIQEKNWPKNEEGELLTHAYTIDLQKFDKRENHEDLSEYRAIVYFVDEKSEDLTTLIDVLLTEEDILKGEWIDCPYTFEHSSIFDISKTWQGHEVEVPFDLFEEGFVENLDELRDEAEDDPDAEYSVKALDLIEQISECLFTKNYVGGGATWLQEDEGNGMGFFIMQFDERFVNINLGDCGIMYVFDDDHLWQCY
ncbi:MAG: WGR domain-containing protein [Cytophagales bacterium]|nr:WGR domain-containing protein [Cytophagales bacterium]